MKYKVEARTFVGDEVELPDGAIPIYAEQGPVKVGEDRYDIVWTIYYLVPVREDVEGEWRGDSATSDVTRRGDC